MITIKISPDVHVYRVLATDVTPLQVTIDGEENKTIEKFICNGKSYEIKINEKGKARMT